MRYETIATLSDETFLITPLEEGQALHFNGSRLTGPVGEPIRVYGSGAVEISQGKWGNRLRVTGEYDGPYFDGSYSPDSDLTPSWTGTANASASVLRAPTVNTVTPNRPNAFNVQSSRWAASGSKSLRIISRTTSSDAAAGIFGSSTGLGGFEAGKTYTVAAYLWLDAPQVESTYSYRRAMRLTTNTVAGWTGAIFQKSDNAPNEAGVHLVRSTFTIPTDATWAYLEFYNGAPLGGGDVWWDLATIVEGSRPDLMPFGTSSATTTITPTAGKRVLGVVNSGNATKLTITPTTGVGQVRLTEGTHTGFQTGDGVPPVEILDPQETLQRVIAGDHRSDFTITVKELG